MLLDCHVIAQDLVIKAFYVFMDRSPSVKVTTLPSFMAIGVVLVVIQCDLSFSSEQRVM